jgi:hypothetical protein
MIMKSNKEIEFIAVNKLSYEVFDKPQKTSSLVPDWYKKQGKYADNKFSVGENGNPNHTIKACMPIFDMMTAGYTITLPADVYFEEDGTVKWSTDMLSAVESHPKSQFSEYNVLDGYKKNIAYKFIQPWIIKTPPGYSTMFIHPTYTPDLPFYTLPAIVDTDKHPIMVNFPFFLKEDFTGLIPYGTPIVQIIPFKRENWKSSSSFSEINQNDLFQFAKKKIGNRYKAFYRTKKVWE